MSISTQLRKLAGDFETLSDPARDDAIFIYDWMPPAWLVGGAFWNRSGVEQEKAQNECIEIAAMLSEAADWLQSLSDSLAERNE